MHRPRRAYARRLLVSCSFKLVRPRLTRTLLTVCTVTRSIPELMVRLVCLLIPLHDLRRVVDMGLHIASVFVILASSAAGVLLPIVAR